jgi:3D (Asp-Asp-Asp) domain-containing protein
VSARPRWWLWIAATVACCGVLALATVPAVLLLTAAGGCDVGYQPGGSGSWVATAYGPPWVGIQGDGITATGIDLRSGRAVLEVAVDPHLIALRSFVHVEPNPFGTTAAFYAGDTGGAIVGRHVDIYDWQGRAAQDAWGARSVSVTAAADPGAGNALGQVQAPALPTPPAGGGSCAASGAGGYQNPFANSTSITPERIDMGVDYSGTGAIDALGTGVVTCAQPAGTGWGPFSCSGGHGGAVVYRLTGGPDAGRYVYVAEGIIPTVTAGEQVQAGQPVATFTGCIETGWGQGAGGDGAMAAAVGQACTSGDAGCRSTWCGWSMSQLIHASGGPSGILQGGGVVGSGC